MVEHQLPKLRTRVRFPSSALCDIASHRGRSGPAPGFGTHLVVRNDSPPNRLIILFRLIFAIPAIINAYLWLMTDRYPAWN
jgi:hypothetical protein